MQTLQTGKPVTQDEPGRTLGFETTEQGTGPIDAQAAASGDWTHSDDFLQSLAAFKSSYQAVQ